MKMLNDLLPLESAESLRQAAQAATPAEAPRILREASLLLGGFGTIGWVELMETWLYADLFWDTLPTLCYRSISHQWEIISPTDLQSKLARRYYEKGHR